jgi:hypothetical protein
MKIRVLDLHPILDPTAPIDAAQPLRHDTFKAHLASLPEHDRALGVDRLAEQDGVDPGDEAVQLGPADLQRQLAPILASMCRRLKATKDARTQQKGRPKAASAEGRNPA